MTDAVKIALIAVIAPTVVSAGAVLLGWINRNKLVQVSQQVDGRLTELLDLTRKSSHAEGVKEQKEHE